MDKGHARLSASIMNGVVAAPVVVGDLSHGSP